MSFSCLHGLCLDTVCKNAEISSTGGRCRGAFDRRASYGRGKKAIWRRNLDAAASCVWMHAHHSFNLKGTMCTLPSCCVGSRVSNVLASEWYQRGRAGKCVGMSPWHWHNWFALPACLPACLLISHSIGGSGCGQKMLSVSVE